MSDKNKILWLEYEDKGQHCFVTATMMGKKFKVESLFWHEETDLNSQEIK